MRTLKTMTKEQMKEEIYYYTGRYVCEEEVEEILDLFNQNPTSDLSEIISDYYNC